VLSAPYSSRKAGNCNLLSGGEVVSREKKKAGPPGPKLPPARRALSEPAPTLDLGVP